MKKTWSSLALVLALCLGLAVPAAAAEQKITVGDQTYGQVLQAILSQKEDKPVSLRLDSDIQLTAAVVLGASDYGGLFDGETITVSSHDVTVDLNGFALTGAKDCAVFEVQSGYTLTLVDSSAARTGRVVSQGETAVDVKDGGVYNALPAAEEPREDAPAPGNPFTDVAADSYCYEAVLWAVEKGITTGKTATTFVPAEDCTRGQIVTFLWRAAGSPEPKLTERQYMDVADANAYYYKAVQWAAEMDMEGSGTFRPNDPCTRFDAVFFLWRAAGSPETETKAAFTDMVEGENVQFLHPIACVAWAVEKGITTGKTETTFAPDEVCTRGQIVTLLFRGLGKQTGQN